MIAVLANEPEAGAFATIIAQNDCLLGAPTQFEAVMVANRDASGGAHRDLLKILSWKNVAIVDFSAAHAAIAYRAFRDFGRGRGHRAALNYGDCMAYAVASLASAPLRLRPHGYTSRVVARLTRFRQQRSRRPNILCALAPLDRGEDRLQQRAGIVL